MHTLVITLLVIAWLFSGAYGMIGLYLEQEGNVKVGDLPIILFGSILGIAMFVVCILISYNDVVLYKTRKQKR
jgi:hypothetical protein